MPENEKIDRVLVVEDEQHLADGLRFNLEAEGYEVNVADTGEGALELLGTRPDGFDVVVLDVMLPGKDGFAVMSELRAGGQYVPTLMLTARGRPEDVLKGFAAGADDYLTKPFELSILFARIRGLLRRRKWLEHSITPRRGGTCRDGLNRRPRVDRSIRVRRQVGRIRRARIARAGAGVSVDADGSQPPALSDPA